MSLISLGLPALPLPAPTPPKAVTRSASGVGYNAAGTGRRSQSWNSTIQGVNSIIFSDQFNLLKRSRDQVRQNPWASAAISSYLANAIGIGIKPHSQHSNPDVRKAIHQAWERSNNELDADDALPFDGLQSLIARSGLEGGECFIRMITDNSGSFVPLKLRVMESEQLPVYYVSMPSTPGGNIVRMGIEMEQNTLRKRVAYHFFSEHPYESVMFPSNFQKYVRIPASDIIHHFKPLRPGQIRGIPYLANTLASLYQIDKIQDAELARQYTQSLFCGFVEQIGATDNILDETNRTTSDPSLSGPLDTAMPGLEPGVMIKLLPGEKISFAEPKGAARGFADFMRVSLHAVATGLDLTYEQLTGDLKEVNYSSIRAGLLEFRRKIEQFQYTVFAFQVLHKVWKRWMEMAVLSGVFAFKDFNDPLRRAEYESVTWQPPGWDWVDPEKDAKATILSIRAGLDSRDRVVRERGLDAEAIDLDNKLGQDRADGLGLVYDSNPSQVLERGQVLTGQDKAQVAEEQEEPAKPDDDTPKTKSANVHGIQDSPEESSEFLQ